MKNDLHIAQIIDSLGEGGAERSLLTFSEVAIRRGIKVTIISLSRKDDGYISSRLRELGANVISIESIKLYHLRPIILLAKAYVRERFDVVQTHLSHGIILGGIVGWILGIPVIATLHNPSPRRVGHFRIRESVWLFVLRFLVKRVIFVSKSVRYAYGDRIPPHKVDTILNSIGIIDLSQTESEKAQIKLKLTGAQNSKIIACVGRLIEGKGIFELLNAFSIIHKIYPEWFLIYIGDGPLKRELILKTQSYGLLDNVRFLGFRNDVREILNLSDIYVSASYSEGMSIALLEAMAAGLPIIATEVGEAPYLLENNRGILIKPRDIDGIVSGFQMLLNHTDLMSDMGKAVKDYVNKNCSPEKWLDELIRVYFLAMS